MATTQEYALLSLYVYNVENDAENRPDLPQGWTLLENIDDNLLGFSYGVFKRSGTNEIVLAYTGTNENVDWASNATAGIGLPSWQVTNAALVYQQVKQTYGGNITLSGHSLGGGLASVMATWFNRPAVVFDEAPFQLTAANPVMLALVRAQLFLAGYSDAAMDKAISDFSSREAQVANHYLQGEILNALRFDANTVAGSDTRIDINGSQATAVQLHSLALLTAARMNDGFRLATYASTSVVPLIMDDKLYAFNTGTSVEKNFLVDLIRSEQSAVVGQGKLTHFAADLNKLGTDIAGLNKQAQDALIAQGIEWYYWQGTDYAGKEFFTQTGALLQYTSAIGDGLQGAQNKAAIYTKLWLDPKALAHGAYAVATTYEQWNVNTGTSAVTATARDVDKTQIFVGNFAAETFTGGNKNDVLLADDGNDTLDGGKGDDKLYGGNGTDTYTFTSSDLAGWGTDTIGDTDGTGIIKIDADTLSGGKSISPLLGRAWISDDKKYQFQFKPNALTPNGTAADSNGTLVIHRTGRLADKEAIVLNNWSQGKFGITLTSDAALPVSPTQIRVVNGDTVPVNTTVSPDTGEVTYTGSATMEAPGNSDALTVYNTSSSIKKIEIYGLDGNDALIGDAAQNFIDGGAGNDLIAGGVGLNTLIGGEGNDIILTHVTPGISGRRGPNDSWIAPEDARTVLAQGATWGVYKNAQGVMHVSTNNTRYDPQAQAGTAEASKTVDVNYFAYSGTINPLDAAMQSWVTETDAGTGNDIVMGGIATDIIDLGAGDDVAFGNLGHDDIRGGAGADRIYGDSGKFGISSGLAYYPVGDDFLDGGQGNDILVGGLGADILHGGGDDDLLFGDYVTVNVAQTTADDWLLGIEPPADASILYYDYADYLDGGAGADTLIAGGGNDTLLGGVGADILQGEQGDDILDGGADNDMLYGGAGDDHMQGGAGDDVLVGGSGSDSLFGGAGKDTLYADAGKDLMDGGEDDDTYVIASAQGVKVIRDGGGVDTLRLASWFSLDGFRLGLGSLKITSPEGDEIHIEGFDPEDPYGSGVIEYFELASGQVISYSELLAALPMFIDGTEGDDSLFGTALNDSLYGFDGNDNIDGRAGNDWIDGGAGADQMTGGAGDDTYLVDQSGDQVIELEGQGHDTVIAQFDYTLAVPNVENLVLAGAAVSGTGNDFDNGLYGNELSNTLMGLAGDDILAGANGNDVLDGGSGADVMSGGMGNDIFHVDNLGDRVEDVATTRQAGVLVSGGQDHVYSSVSYTLGSGIESLTLEGAASIDGHGAVESNRIVGNAADNVLTAYSANGLLDYFNRAPFKIAGDAEYVPYLSMDGERMLDHLYHSSFEKETGVGLPGQGTLRIDISSPQGDELFGGEGDDQLWGDINGDLLVGGGGNDLLVGYWGGDILQGGTGDDTYVVDSSTQWWDQWAQRGSLWIHFEYQNGDDDQIVEENEEGIDTVLSLNDYVLGANLENLTLVDGFANGPREGDLTQDLLYGDSYSYGYGQIGVGNNLSNVIIGNSRSNQLNGLGGVDTLIGKGGHDRLDGGTGDDLMQGGDGYDTYVVDSVGDTVVEENADEWSGGRDAVETTLDGYRLGAHVEDLYLMGNANIGGTGNELANELYGNSAANVLDGLEGDDELYGNGGDDTLIAGSGNDWLNGGIGSDFMSGGQGDDGYNVDDAGDVVSELDGEGHDRVYSEVSYTLGAGVEDLRLYDSSVTVGLYGRGNQLANTIHGGYSANRLEGLEGDDTLNGGGGTDTLVGGVGNDVYYTDRASDVVIELANEGTDEVRSSSSYSLSDHVENLTLLGDFSTDSSVAYGSHQIEGNSAANRVIGNDGHDTALGHGGNDAMDGRAGNDVMDGGDDDDVMYGGADAIYAYLEVADQYYGGVSRHVELLAENADELHGGGGNDQLDGGSGNDQLFGDQGDDVLHGGADGLVARSEAYIQYDVEVTPASERFHTNDDTLDGGAGNDALDGGSGNDLLLGGDGDDHLYGGDDGPLNVSNNDVLDGGAGIDTMRGGTGDDIYMVDGIATLNPEGKPVQVNLCDEEHRFGVDRAASFNWTADSVVEEAGQGVDAVYSTASVATVNVETVTLLSTGSNLDIDASTGAGDQVLTGNVGHNRLDGGAGADRMIGGLGDDTYLVDDVLDQVVESANEGFDTVRTAINDFTLSADLEGLVLEDSALTGNGNSADNVLIGNSQDNILYGLNGNDTLAGWRGDDELRGGAGDDTYAFSRGDGIDTVIDSEGSGRLHFSGDIAVSDLVFSSVGDDLLIDVLEAGVPNGDRVILKNWMVSSERVDSLSFCGNVSLPLDESVLNRAPEALADHAEVAEDVTVTASGNVLSNDNDPNEGQTLTVKNPGTFAGLYGSLTLAGDGSYLYVLDNARADIQALGAGDTREESFSYTVHDDGFGALEAVSTVSFILRGTNDGPIVLADVAQVQEDVTPEVTGNVLTNDSDVDTGDHLAVADFGVKVGQYGQLTLAANGDYVYALNNVDIKVQSLAAGQTVTDSFSYTAQDDSVEPALGNSEVVVTVTGVNDAPVLNVPLADRVVAVGQTVAFGLPPLTFSDIDQGDVLTYAAQAVDADGNVQALPTWLSFDVATRTFRGIAVGATDFDIRVIATDRSGATAVDEFNFQATISDDCGKGNEGVGNGEDPPPPGHDTNWNDGPGTSPGKPGRRGGGKRTSTSTDPGTLSSADDQIWGGYEDGWDTVISTVNYVLPAHMQALVLDGSGAINAMGNSLDNWLVGNSGNNVLNAGSGSGTDILQGGQGRDQLMDAAGSNLLDGGAGVDVLTDGEGASWLFGGKGNDTINFGQGVDLLGFNRGDGADILNSGQEALANDIVSLGKGIRYADLRLAKNGSDLVLDAGLGDSITFSKWYAGSANKGVCKLQIVTAEGDYDATSTDKTRNQQVEVFDFSKLVQKFDAARAANPATANGWALMNSLLDAHLQGSNTAALGGDLSYQYATAGSLAGIGLGAAQVSLAAGTDWQNLKSRSELEQGNVKLL
ncbi:VCBS domain-containing protein [Polaromonas sp. AER18D-145]|uniref:VCBS domain-containing protein n=1 Tax=Polaromonas sp. AER18D-145 TaxID=1977060 RepID=UPI000BBC9C72|nr:VCBS domain-containing protein [Polaromonas sp. AER18D-145]